MKNLTSKFKGMLSNEYLGETDVPFTKPNEQQFSPPPLSGGGNSFEKRHGVLDLLGIPHKRDFSHLISVEELEEVQFSRSAPIGLDIEEVDEFCTRIENEVREYRELLTLRDNDFDLLLKEFIKMEQRMSDMKQEFEMASLIRGHKGIEEEYLNQIVELKIENEKLQEELNRRNRDTKKTTDLPLLEVDDIYDNNNDLMSELFTDD